MVGPLFGGLNGNIGCQILGGAAGFAPPPPPPGSYAPKGGLKINGPPVPIS